MTSSTSNIHKALFADLGEVVRKIGGIVTPDDDVGDAFRCFMLLRGLLPVVTMWEQVGVQFNAEDLLDLNRLEFFIDASTMKLGCGFEVVAIDLQQFVAVVPGHSPDRIGAQSTEATDEFRRVAMQLTNLGRLLDKGAPSH